MLGMREINYREKDDLLNLIVYKREKGLNLLWGKLKVEDNFSDSDSLRTGSLWNWDWRITMGEGFLISSCNYVILYSGLWDVMMAVFFCRKKKQLKITFHIWQSIKYELNILFRGLQMFSYFLSNCKLRILHCAELQKQRGNSWEYNMWESKMCEACRKVESNQ